MYKINVYFENHDPISIHLIDHPVAEKFFYLSRKHYQNHPVVFRDNIKYTMKYFEKLAAEANDKLNWNWKTKNITSVDTIVMHEDLEKVLNDEGDFSVIPEHLDNLIHELHYCLHNIQFKENPSRSGHFQIEWFTNKYLDIDDDFRFTTDIGFGDLILQNPFVGHNPLRCYTDNDFDDITRTCKIPVRIKSGIVIATFNKLELDDPAHYYEWWHTKGKAVVDQVGYSTILKYTGEGKIGEVTNKENLLKILQSTDILIFDKLEFFS